MDRGKPRGARKSPNRRGLAVVVEPNGYLYIKGTFRALDRKVRVRKSTGLHKEAPGADGRAEEIRRALEKELQDEIVHGIQPAPRFAEAAERYLIEQAPGPTQENALAELDEKFGGRKLNEIEAEAIDRFYGRRFKGAAPATIRRHQAALIALFNHADVPLPKIARPKVKSVPGRHMAKRFLPGEPELLVRCAEPHAKPFIATLLATGARVGMTAGLLKEHFILVPGRGRVFFPRTKNARAYDRPLHDFAVNELLAWLERRDDDHPEMFLTNKGRPYAERKAEGGQIRKAFNTAKRRAAEILEDEGQPERARVIAQATPHWCRHNLANTLRRELGWDAKRIAEAGMWESSQVVEAHYIGDESDLVEAGLRGLEFDQNLTNSPGRNLSKA